MGNRIYSGKSIAEQLLGNTWVGQLLYGKPETYKDGYGTERKDTSFKESANGQLVQRMGETAKDAGGLVATGLAFGNPLTAGEAMAPLIAGSQAYWIGHGINDGAQRIENIGEGVKNFIEDPSRQNAGAVAKEVPMLVLDVAGALPVARTVIETGKNIIPSAQQTAQRIAGSVNDAITTATKQAVESGVVEVNELPAQLAARATSTPTITSPTLDRTVEIQNRVFTGDPIFPKTTWQIPAFNANSAYRLTGQSQIDDMIQTGFVRPRSGKIKGGHTNEVHWSAGNAKSGYNIQPGQYILESPRDLVDGTSNAIGVNDLSHVWTTRNGQVVDVIDEIRPHMRTVGSPSSSKGSYAWFERPSKLTFEERMGIPKGERNQLAKSPTKNPNWRDSDVIELPDGTKKVVSSEYPEDVMRIMRSSETKQIPSEVAPSHESLISWYQSPQYKERLINAGFSEEQANIKIAELTQRLSPENITYVTEVHTPRSLKMNQYGNVVGVNPSRHNAFAAMYSGHPDLPDRGVIQITKSADIPETVFHEGGGHHTESLLSDYSNLYSGQTLTKTGEKASISKGLPGHYYPSWNEARARAMTIANQMRTAGWNPNSPEQVNVWLNKHLLKDHNTNVVQGALYYDRPKFIKAVATGLKQGGKL